MANIERKKMSDWEKKEAQRAVLRELGEKVKKAEAKKKTKLIGKAWSPDEIVEAAGRIHGYEPDYMMDSVTRSVNEDAWVVFHKTAQYRVTGLDMHKLEPAGTPLEGTIRSGPGGHYSIYMNGEWGTWDPQGDKLRAEEAAANDTSAWDALFEDGFE